MKKVNLKNTLKVEIKEEVLREFDSTIEQIQKELNLNDTNRLNLELLKNMSLHYSKDDLVLRAVDIVNVTAGGYYHIEPDSLIFIKKEYDDADFKNIIIRPDETIEIKTSTDKFIPIDKNSFLDIGILA